MNSQTFPGVDPATRYRMARVSQRNTKPEIQVRRLLHYLGYRFRLHRANLPGNPDIVFPSRRAVIFVHGCFWHQHEGCARARRPVSRLDYWIPKLARNVERDERAVDELEAARWSVMTVWECETKPGRCEELARRLISFLG